MVSLPTTEISFFRNRRGYCCTNARVECSFMLEGMAGQAASTRPRTGSCCCSCCRSAISVGEARWSGPLELPQCRTAPLHCPVPPDSSSTLSAGASRQLRYTVSWSVMTLLLPILLASASFVGEWDGELRGIRLEAWMKSHKSEVAITYFFICTPTRKQCRLSPEMNT